MKRVGILTFHKSINYGAFMQCYSLSQRMQRDFSDCRVEVIDYVPLRTLAAHDVNLFSYLFGSRSKRLPLRMTATRVRSLLLSPGALAEQKTLVKAFQADWPALPLSKRAYYTDDYEAVLADLAERYDAVVVGSDCVWEFLVDRFPNVFFLGTDAIHAKFSYAASSDRMYLPHIPQDRQSYIRQALKPFRYLGIRDVSTEHFLGKLLPSAVLSHNCDPTLLLDLNVLPSDLERVKKQLAEHGIDGTRPIIGIMGDDNIGALIRRIFGREYPVVAVYSNTKYADYFLNDLRPLEWARVFSLFSVTFTRYFHGTILSLKNGTPTITLDPWKMEDAEHITKIKDLYNRLDLNEHYFLRKTSYSEEDVQAVSAAARRFLAEPDREKIAAAVEREAASYESFREAFGAWVQEA